MNSKHLLLGSLLAVAPFTARTQHLSFGPEGGLSQSTQLYTDPSRPQDGRTQMGWLSSWNAGIQATLHHLGARPGTGGFAVKARLLYAQKGFIQVAQVSDPLAMPEPGAPNLVINPREITLRNTLGYLSFDVLLQSPQVKLGRDLGVFAEAGIGNNFLLSSHLEAGSTAPVNLSQPYNEYHDGVLRGYNLSWIGGIGLSVRETCSLFLQTNRGITPVYRSNSLRVTDWVWTFGVAVHLFNTQKAAGGL